MNKIFTVSAGLMLFFSLVSVGQAATKAEDSGEYNVLLKDGEVRNIATQELPEFMDNDQVDLIEPNHYRKIQAKYPNDPSFNVQWYLDQASGADVDAPQAWGEETGKASVVVAVIDTGADMNHPDLVNNFWVNSGEIPNNHIDDDNNGYVDDVNGWNFLDNNNNLNPVPDGGDDAGVSHGTHVAGIIGAVGNNSIGVTGLSWNVSIMVIKVLDDEGVGNTYDIAQGINYAKNNGADIINLSFGAYGEDTLEKNAIEAAQHAGLITIAALGNDSINVNNLPIYPACYNKVLGVTSTNSNDNASWFTNYGSDCADVAAPGSAIYSTLFYNAISPFDEEYGYMSGTSMATPVVAGIAALLKADIPSENEADIIDAIRSSTDDVGLAVNMGTGRVNAKSALDALQNSSRPTRPKNLVCYKGRKKNKLIERRTRTNAKKPFCTWKKGNSDEDIAGYHVYYGTNENANPKKKGTFKIKRKWRAKKERNANEVAFYVRVKSVNTAGNSSKKSRQYKFIMDTKMPRPKMNKILRTNQGLLVEWYRINGNYVEYYNIYRWKKKKQKYVKIAQVPSSYYYYLDTTAQKGKTYKYKVKAKDDLGNYSKFSKRRLKYY
ncbi:S8 family serine peptidase [Patescibacteria group bacterium]|nr:S8 family serine peptidase [Patescibacteria group bacterium]MBU1673323.1 S8 family serine peptidase [Patescibacteria group bacterium]MBU1963558.1 S8 family serine peptidase [Patescibacteria group bacterium]